MKKLICPKRRQVHPQTTDNKCPACGGTNLHNFRNSDKFLREEAAVVLEQRNKLGLKGLVGSISCIIINTEPENQIATVQDLLRFTGLNVEEAFKE